MKKFLIILILASALGFTACSSSDDDSPSLVEGLYSKASPTGNDTAIDVSAQSGNNIVEKAVTYVKANPSAGTVYTLAIGNDYNVGSQTLNSANIDLTIIGIGSERKISLSSNGALFTLSASSVKLTLGNNLTLVGRKSGGNGNENNNNVLVSISSGELIMLTGSAITGNTNTSNTGGGVQITGGTLTINGGKIIGNNATSNGGGGVALSSGTFTMNSGEISGNTTNGNGGGVYMGWGTFTMYGGKIAGNSTNTNGGGIRLHSSTTPNLRIVTGTIYGSDEADPDLKNTATTAGAALSFGGGTAEYGTFVSGTWTKTTDGDLDGDLATTNNTINVVNGVLQ